MNQAALFLLGLLLVLKLGNDRTENTGQKTTMPARGGGSGRHHQMGLIYGGGEDQSGYRNPGGGKVSIIGRQLSAVDSGYMLSMGFCQSPAGISAMHEMHINPFAAFDFPLMPR